LPLLERARAFAEAAHAGQLRKGTTRPYIVHPLAVATTLARHYPERLELICAGYLHDTVEDTPVTLAEIETTFSPAVARLVAAVTAVRGKNWRATRTGQLAALEGADRDVLRLKAADALSNASATVADLAAEGPTAWRRFGATPDEVRWYYRGILARVRAGLGEEPLVGELAEAVAGLG
jgi:(p)ppGpp synthase/HD superfamily hydrolase